MELLSSYAHQVVSYLPPAQRDDTYAEVYDSLCEEFADWRETSAKGDQADFLNETKDHPMRYATRLAAEDSAYLIGPRFYFSFLAALKTALTVVVVLFTVIAVVNALAWGQVVAAVINMLVALPEAMLWVGAAVLGVFVALEKSGENASWLEHWQASDLVAVDEHDTISRGETVFELVVATFFLLWVLGRFELPGMIRQDGALAEALTVNLPVMYWWVLGLVLVFDIVFTLHLLRRSLWTTRLRLVKIGNDLFWFALLAYAVVQPALLTAEHPSVVEFMPVVQHATRGFLMVTMALTAWDLVSHIRRILRVRAEEHRGG